MTPLDRRVALEMAAQKEGVPVETLERRADMDLRDWFAGMALVSFGCDPSLPSMEDVSRNCYLAADAMMAERAKRR